MNPPRSLKARALQLLAQREQSRVELRRKLLAFARADDARADDARADAARADAARADDARADDVRVDDAPADDAPADEGQQAGPSGLADALSRVEAVLDWLAANRFASDERFAESRVHARSSRYGNLRIRQELKQHAVALSPEAAAALAQSEAARAAAVYRRRFEVPPGSAAEHARRARFMAARGFSPPVIRQVLRTGGAADDEADEPD